MFWNVKFWQNLAWWNPLLKLAWAKTDQMDTKRVSAPPLHIVHLTHQPPLQLSRRPGGGVEKKKKAPQLESAASVPGPGPPCLLLYSHIHSYFPATLSAAWDWPGLSWCRVISVMWQQQQQQQQQQHHLQQQQQQHGDPVACSRARPKRESDCLHSSTTGLLLLHMNLDNRIWYLCEWR